MTRIKIFGPEAVMKQQINNKAEDLVLRSFNRFSEILREVEVRFFDINGPKGGIDKLCKVKITKKDGMVLLVKSSSRSFIHAAKLALVKSKKGLRRKLSKRKVRDNFVDDNFGE